MFMIHLPRSMQIGDTEDCIVNGKPKKVTWRDESTLVIEPGDARRILMAAPEGDLTCFMCADADGSGTVITGDATGHITTISGLNRHDRRAAQKREK